MQVKEGMFMQCYAKASTGFTVIEFVMVFVILAVLSAYAFPRFADMSSQAETTLLEGALTSARTSAGVAHAHWLAAGKPDRLIINGLEVVTQNGYPSANLAQNLTKDDQQNKALGLIEGYDNTICGLAGLSAQEYRCQTDEQDSGIIHITLAKAQMGSACFRYHVPDSPDGRPMFTRVLQSHNLHQLADEKDIREGWHADANSCLG